MKELFLLTPCLVQISDEDFAHLVGFGFTFDEDGYLKCGGKPYRFKRLHRIIAVRTGLLKDLDDPREIDHIDNNKLNNQRSNLRIATDSQNKANTPLQRNNRSGYKGVSETEKGLQRASIKINGHTKNLGDFVTEEEAYAAYVAKAKEAFGEFFNPG